MALVMSGEVIVESITVSRNEPVTMKVLGPGSLVGEVGLVDRDPRTASVTASTDVLCAILSRDDLAELIGSEPSIGAKLMLAIAARMAERMRDTVRKLRLYTKLAKVMQEEIDTLLRVPVARRGADASDAEAHVLAVTNWREHERRSEPRSEPFSG